jgi:transposase
MDARELQLENERLKKLLSDSKDRLATVTAQLESTDAQLQQTKTQHEAVTQQFTLSLEERDRQVASLEKQIERLLLQIRGSRQERIDPDQLLLFSVEELRELADQLGNGDPEDDLIDDASTGKSRKRRSRGRSGSLPDHLEREVIRHELSEAKRACPCCGEVRQEIGVESSEQLEIIPAKLKVVRHERVKYACRSCQENVVVAAKPPQPIEKGLPGPGLCAHTVLSKFGDHQPLYRQEDIHSRLGMTIRRSTLCGWLVALAELSQPLVMRMKHLLLQSQVIHTDDTKIKMLDPGRGVARECKFWPYLGDWLHPYAVYDFTLTRERDGPKNFLAGFSGYLQADAYSGYNCVFAGGDVAEVACWIHARRYWYESLDNDPVRANTALGYIARLSQIEKELSRAYPAVNLQGERDFEAVARGRQEHAAPILDEFKAWLDEQSCNDRLLPKSDVRKAFTYTLNQWEALCRYTSEGYLCYDNNAAERLVKLSAIGRKNFLFVGNERGGHNAAIFYSLVSSAKANGVEPFAWLRSLFTQLPYHRDGEAFAQAVADESVTSVELDQLLPDRWLQANPNHKWTIDEVRREERKRSNRRRRKRLTRRRK